MEFSFEKLQVWKKAVDFSTKVINVSETINTDRKHFRLIEQLESSSTSIALNIAEGTGRYSKKEFIRFLYIARGSLYETITLLTIFQKKNWISEPQLNDFKIKSNEIGRMISSLVTSIRKSL